MKQIGMKSLKIEEQPERLLQSPETDEGLEWGSDHRGSEKYG